EIAWLAMRLAREGAGDASELSGSPLALRAAITALESELEGLERAGDETASVRAARARYEEALREEASLAAIVRHAEGALTGACGTCRAAHHEPESVERDLAHRRKQHARAAARLARARAKLEAELQRSRARARAERKKWADVRDRLGRARELERHLERRAQIAAKLERAQ